VSEVLTFYVLRAICIISFELASIFFLPIFHRMFDIFPFIFKGPLLKTLITSPHFSCDTCCKHFLLSCHLFFYFASICFLPCKSFPSTQVIEEGIHLCFYFLYFLFPLRPLVHLEFIPLYDVRNGFDLSFSKC
jgi:hypothetical protein